MPTPRMTDEEVRRRVQVWEDCGRNVSEASRVLGLSRPSVRETLQRAIQDGLIDERDYNSPNTPTASDYETARVRKIAAFQKKKRKGDWRKPVATTIPGRPFRLKIFGDPHLDADGCNFELFERHWLEMDAASGVYGVCVGDWFNNWLRALGHLWKKETTDPSDAWLCLDYLMDQRGDALIAACSGNHDDWTHAPVDPVDLLMKKHGVLYREGAIRVMVNPEGCDPMFWSIRHKWRGASMYSAAHGIRRAAEKGWRDLLMVGGHIHQDEDRHYIDPRTGEIAHILQVSAFKEYDEFADIHGFMGPKISPVRDLVIDPRLPDTDPDKVKVFYSSERAAAVLEAIR